MKVVYVVMVRNKAHLARWLERSVRSALAQSYRSMEIILADGRSTDGTREILERLAAEHRGANRVRVVECGGPGGRGHSGFNGDLAWLHQKLDYDIFIPQCGDDYVAPARAARMVEAFESSGAAMVNSAMYFEDPAGKEPLARSTFQRPGWAEVRHCVEDKIGCGCPAWRRELFDRIAPIPMTSGLDIWMPPLAAVLGGLWWVNEPLYTYVRHAEPDNLGFEGARSAATDEAGRRAIEELMFFQIARGWRWALAKMKELGAGTAEDHSWIRETVFAHEGSWSDMRETMSLKREPSRLLPV